MHEDQKTNEEKVLDLLVSMSEAYGKSYSAGALNLMLKLLDDVTHEELQKALASHTLKSKWMPTIGDLRELIDEIRRPAWEVMRRRVIADMEKKGKWDWNGRVNQETVDKSLVELGYKKGKLDANKL